MSFWSGPACDPACHAAPLGPPTIEVTATEVGEGGVRVRRSFLRKAPEIRATANRSQARASHSDGA